MSKNWAAIWARRLAFWLFWPALILVVWGELTPHPPRLDAPDKLLHFLAYFGLSGIATTALGRGRVVLAIVLGLIALGGALEILQNFTAATRNGWMRRPMRPARCWAGSAGFCSCAS